MDSHNPFHEHAPALAVRRGRPGISFSAVEMLHLAAGVAILTFAFAVVRGPATYPERLLPSTTNLLASFLAVTTGFVLHELAHKIVAQRYGHWAEFRAAFLGLLFALGIAIFSGLLAALPGATWIQGNVTRKESGVISLVGPGLNFVVAWAAFPFAIALNPNDTVPTIFSMVAQVNSVLALFNLLPLVFFGVALDGRKVWRWNPWIWTAAFVAAAATFGIVNLRILHFV